LGLVALDAHDALRVWLRFVSLVLGICSFFYFVLVVRFGRWWPVPGVTALMVLCMLHTFALLLLGWGASRRRPISDSSSAAPPPWSDPTVPPPPQHPKLLFAAKWVTALPLSLLAAFLAAFLGAALADWLNFTTEGSLSNTQQFFTIVILAATAFVSLASQTFMFLVASAMQQQRRPGASEDTEGDDLAWQLMHLEQQHGDAARAGVPAVDATEDEPL